MMEPEALGATGPDRSERNKRRVERIGTSRTPAEVFGETRSGWFDSKRTAFET